MGMKVIGGSGNLRNRENIMSICPGEAYHEQEVESATDDIKASVLQPEQVQVLTSEAGGLLWCGVCRSTAELSAPTRATRTPTLQMTSTHFSCKLVWSASF